MKTVRVALHTYGQHTTCLVYVNSAGKWRRVAALFGSNYEERGG